MADFGKITKSFVDKLVEPGRYRDSELRGFGIRVSPKMKKVYFVENVLKGERKAVTVTIGKHGTFSPDEAREEARQILAQLAKGINPNQDRRDKAAKSEAARQLQASKKKIVLSGIFEEYLEQRHLKERTAYSYRCDFEKCLSDWLGTPLTDITTDMVKKRHNELSLKHPGQANTVMRILRALFNYSIAIYPELIKSNPVQMLNNLRAWNRLTPRSRIIKDDQLKAWFDSVNSLPDLAARDYLLLLLLTGLRKNEAASLKWSDVDFVNATLTIFETKNGRDHTLPLGDYLLRLLKERAAGKEIKTEIFVFPGAGKNGYRSDMRKQIDEVKKACGVKFTPHDLRRTFTTVAGRLQPEYIVKSLTNHMDKTDVTQTHYFMPEVKNLVEPMQSIEDHILEKAGQSKSESCFTAPNVVSMSGRRKTGS
ncbi:tyrosine-type recombinase/integrase [bacterium]|nr:tyrosine-type recombinase/integrase [bacterium]